MNSPIPASALTGEIWGYDPGGNGKHGVARLTVKGNHALDCRCALLRTPHEVLDWFGSSKPLALGVDTLTAWSTGPSGDRPADRWLRATYPDVALSVMSPGSLRGAMCVNGMAVVHCLRQAYGAITVTETHPKVAFHHLTGSLYRDASLPNLVADLTAWLGLNLNISSGDEWDAAISAYAAWQGLLGQWPQDLHQLPWLPGEKLVHPCGTTSYYWPQR